MTFPILPSNSAVGGYQVQRSLRFNSADSAYLNRTFTTPTSSTVWTLSLWIKRGLLTGTYRLFGASTTTYLTFNSSDQLNLTLNGTSAATSTAVFRDPSAWYHIVYQQNGAAQTIYVNNSSVATGTTAASVFNTAIVHQLGSANTSNYFNGYMTEVNFIDGQALTPSSFGETNATTGQWQPKRYTGTYGTNGFYLNFSDNSGTTATTLGKDYSGNGNNWTPNNFSVTAGAGNDSMIDVPTNWDDGGNGRGNYCTLNPINLVADASLANGNLNGSFTSASAAQQVFGTIAASSGKWYFEVTQTALGAGAGGIGIGVANITARPSVNNYVSGQAWMYYGFNGFKYHTSGAAYGATFGTGSVIGVGLDMDAGTITFYKDGVTQGVAFTNLAGNTVTPIVADDESNATKSFTINTGQRPFAYTPPSGFKALNTQNIAAGTITTSGTFTGNVNADGPFVWLNGVPTAMTINGNAVTFGTHADKLSNGFKVRTSSTSYNNTGSNTYSITTTGARFKVANAQGNP